jgi:hypothetical protein
LISHNFIEEKRQITDFEYPTYDGKVGKAGVDFPVGNFMSLVQQEDESIIVFGGNILIVSDTNIRVTVKSTISF